MALPIAGTATWGEQDSRSFRRLTVLWMWVVVIVLFPLLGLFGCYLRLSQANLLRHSRPEWFYAVLTLHGLGMVELWYVGGMAAMSYLLSRYVHCSLQISRLALCGTILGFGLLAASTLGGLFGAGWTFLYPLPFYSQAVWPAWATGCFFASLALQAVVWTVWSLDVLRAIFKRYSLPHALAWHYLMGRKDPDIPPIVLIAMVALLPAVACLLDAGALLILYALQWCLKGFVADALVMKNMTYFFGHIIANITLYLGVAVVYELLPSFSKRPWKTSRMVALAWNSVLAMVLMASFHHLYMDFVQPRMFQDMGQIMSYFSAVPAAVVSIFGGLAVVYASRMRWTLGSVFLFFGLMGWAVGGVGALIDSTISANFRFHNTLWVVAHFHTYYLMGVVLMILGFASYLSVDLSGSPEHRGKSWLIFLLFLIGGYGFVATFYWAGAHSIPRRYATYPQELLSGTADARVSLAFIALLLIGTMLYLWEIGKRLIGGFSAQHADVSQVNSGVPTSFAPHLPR